MSQPWPWMLKLAPWIFAARTPKFYILRCNWIRFLKASEDFRCQLYKYVCIFCTFSVPPARLADPLQHQLRLAMSDVESWVPNFKLCHVVWMSRFSPCQLQVCVAGYIQRCYILGIWYFKRFIWRCVAKMQNLGVSYSLCLSKNLNNSLPQESNCLEGLSGVSRSAYLYRLRSKCFTLYCKSMVENAKSMSINCSRIFDRIHSS